MQRFKKLALSLIALTTFLIPQVASAKVKVVATLGDLAATARAVGGKDADVVLLASPHQDPHFVKAKPSFIRKVAEADLLVLDGMQLEIGWLPTLTRNSHNGKIQRGEDGYFDASEYVHRMEVPKTKISRAQGDIHAMGNPHYTYDPRQMARVGLALGQRLAKIDPSHAAAYKKRAHDFAKQELQTAKFWKQKFSELPAKCRKVVVYHEAWIYVTDWLGLNMVMPVEPKPGVPPNPRHVAKLFQTMKEEHVPVIIQMEYYPDSNTDMLAKRTGAYQMHVQGQARPIETYQARINKMVGELYGAIKSRCQ